VHHSSRLTTDHLSESQPAKPYNEDLTGRQTNKHQRLQGC